MDSPAPSLHGWTAVPRSLDVFLKSAHPENTKPFAIDEIKIPSSDVAKKTQAYAKQHLSEPTYNHSMRVFYYGTALLLNHAPSSLLPSDSIVETFFLSALLHDIGTVPENLRGTRLSFELWGAIEALKILPELGAPRDQAELVAEVINRHQDLGEIGYAPAVLGLIYFGTIFDNVGLHPDLVHVQTIENVVGEYPRLNWTACFASTIREEVGLKPWAHTTVIDKFAKLVEANKLMEPYE